MCSTEERQIILSIELSPSLHLQRGKQPMQPSLWVSRQALAFQTITSYRPLPRKSQPLDPHPVAHPQDPQHQHSPRPQIIPHHHQWRPHIPPPPPPHIPPHGGLHHLKALRPRQLQTDLATPRFNLDLLPPGLRINYPARQRPRRGRDMPANP